LFLQQLKFKKMKKENSNTAQKLTITVIALLVAVSGLFISCTKSVEGSTDVTKNMDQIARLLGSRTISGSIAAGRSDGELALNYNHGSKIILIDELAGADHLYVKSMQSADLIISKYGVVILDPSNNTLILMENNDPESIGKFSQVKSLLPAYDDCTRIFGTTVINGENL
jgi:hypothetical protein